MQWTLVLRMIQMYPECQAINLSCPEGWGRIYSISHFVSQITHGNE